MSSKKKQNNLANKIFAVRDQFDVALLACNGFSGMMGDYIKKIGKNVLSTVGNLIVSMVWRLYKK